MIRGRGRVVAERLAHAPDVDVDDPLVAVEVVAPDLLEELLAGEHPAGRLGERDEEVELEGGQGDRAAGGGDLAAALVDGQPVEAEDAVVAVLGRARPSASDRLLGAAQHRLDPGDDLAGAERLGDVVVGADAEADEGVDLLARGP